MKATITIEMDGLAQEQNGNELADMLERIARSVRGYMILPQSVRLYNSPIHDSTGAVVGSFTVTER